MKTMNWMPIGVVDQIGKFKFAIKQANIALGELKRQEQEWRGRLNEQARHFLEGKGITGDIWFDLEGGWDCPDSPIGVCVYDRAESYQDDCCEICGNPDERK